MEAIVSMKWLLARLYEPDIVIVDCRFALGDPEAGQRAYREERIPGAYYMDLERDLSAPKGEHGGRHPLPDAASLAGVFGRAGIDGSVRVVAYDDQGGAMASRLWWLLQYLGHERVYVLDQGYSAWKAAGFPVVSAEPDVKVPRRFEPHIRPELLADMEEVRGKLGREDVVLIDSREAPRYLGRQEPIDPVAGHIPGAVNRFWKDALTPEGGWRPAERQQERFADIPEDREIIVYCGSGVTACPNVLALREAGYRNVKLYAGSWSDWISYEGNPIATGEE